MWPEKSGVQSLIEDSDDDHLNAEENMNFTTRSSSEKSEETDFKRQSRKGSFLSPLCIKNLYCTPRLRSPESEHELDSLLVTPSMLSISPCVFTPSCSNIYNFPSSSSRGSHILYPSHNISIKDLVPTTSYPPERSTPSLVFEDGFEACLEITPPKSSISVMTSPSGGPICRICLDGDSKESFISPCNCSGSMAQIHKSCLERWLSTSNDCECELCLYNFRVERVERSFMEFLMNNENEIERRAILSDIFCLIILTPLILGTAFVCISGAFGLHYWPAHAQNTTNLYKPNPRFNFGLRHNGTSYYWDKMYNVTTVKNNKPKKSLKSEEIFGLMFLTAVLLFVYAGWFVASIIYHHRAWKKWSSVNQRIILIEPMG